MPSFNKVILMGNLTADPVSQTLDSGMEICKFTLAVNETYKGKEETLYMDVTVFNKQAINCAKYLAKGNPVLVDGKLKQENWETPEGQKRSKITMTAFSVTFISKGEKPKQEGDDNPFKPKEPINLNNDIPF